MTTKITGTIKSNLRDDIRANLIPLVKLGEEVAQDIQVRVHDEGLAADGSLWSAYKSKRKPPKSGDRFYWTRAGEPQPEQHRIVVGSSGKYAGRAAYPSYAHYREAMGADGDQKRFILTGELRDSLTVTATAPNKATVHYGKKPRVATYGRAKSGKSYTNEKVAQFAFRTERIGPMQPSPEELANIEQFLEREIPPQLLKNMSAAATQVKSTRIIGRANKLLKGGV